MNTKVMHPKQTKLVVTGFLTAIMLIAAGCGSSGGNGFKTDPLAGNPKYKQMEHNGVPQTGPVVTTVTPPPPPPPPPKVNVQTVINAIFPEPDLNGQVLNFVEGEKSTYRMTIRVLQPGIKYAITASGLPKEASFAPVKDAPDVYELSWTPAIGAAQGKSVHITKFKVILNVTATNSPETAKLMESVAKEHELALVIAGGHSLPLVEKVEISTNSIEEGSSVAFTVFVKDAVAQAKGTLPEMTIVADTSSATQEQAVLQDVTRYVHMNRTGRIVDGGFAFDGRFDAANVSFPDKAEKLEARFVLIAMNDQARSPGKLEVLTITKKAIAPLPAVAPVAPKAPQAAAALPAPAPAPAAAPVAIVPAKVVTGKKLPVVKVTSASKATHSAAHKTAQKSTKPAAKKAVKASTKAAPKTSSKTSHTSAPKAAKTAPSVASTKDAAKDATKDATKDAAVNGTASDASADGGQK